MPLSIEVSADIGLLERMASSVDCPPIERQWANAALDRLQNRSVRGVVCAHLLAPGDNPIAVEFQARVKQFDCLLCPDPLLNGEVVLLWTTIHAIHRRCLEGSLKFEEIPRDTDVPEAILRLRQKGRLGR